MDAIRCLTLKGYMFSSNTDMLHSDATIYVYTNEELAQL